MNYDIKESGNRTHRLRMNTGLTREKAANALNVDRSFYSRIESGKNGCSVDLLVQMSILFDVSLDYLVLGKCHQVPLSDVERTLLKDDIEKLIVHMERFRTILWANVHITL